MENLRNEEFVATANSGAPNFATVAVDSQPALSESGQKVATWRTQPVIAGLGRALISRLYPALIILAGVIALGLMVIPNDIISDSLGEGQALILAVTLVGLMGGLLELWRSAKRTGSDDEKSPTEYKVVLVLSRHRLPYAADKGMVTFSDGYFFFEGAATMFSFSRHVVRRLRPRSFLAIKDGACRIIFGVEGADHELSMSSNHSRAFERSFNGWMNSAVKAIEEVLPPTRANASGLRLARLEVVLILSNLGFAMASLGIWAKILSHKDPFNALVPLIVDPNNVILLWLAVAIPTLVFAVAIPLFQACRWIKVLKRELNGGLVGVRLAET